MTAPYKRMDILKADYGETISVALCKNMEGVRQAQEDGFDAALLRNSKTIMWSMFMELCVNHGILDRMVNSRSHRAATFGSRMRAKIFDKVQSRVVKEFGGVPTRVSDIVPAMESGSGIHCDVMHGEKDMLMILTTWPTTVLYTKKPVEYKGQDAFQVGDEEFVFCDKVENKDDPRVPHIQPKNGTAVFLFNAANDATIAHAVPSRKYHDYHNRARVALDIGAPSRKALA